MPSTVAVIPAGAPTVLVPPAEEKEVKGDAKDGEDEEEEESTRLKKGALINGKAVCIYDDKCYRKNPLHFAQYAHPKREAFLTYKDALKLMLRKTESAFLSAIPFVSFL